MAKRVFTVHPMFFFLFLLLVQSQFGLGQHEQNHEPLFTAVSSLFFRPGTDYNVFFTVDPHPSNEPLQLKCVLMAKSNNDVTIESEPIFLRPGESGNISITLPREMPGNETEWRLFAWPVTEESTDDDYLYSAPHTLIVSSEVPNSNRHSLASVFIQTDKPAYKPDDLVQIRVITMGSDDLPHLTAGVNLTITDSHGNIMKKWEQPIELPTSASVPSKVSTDRSITLFGEFQKKTNGLSAYEYQLSSEPILGNWTIEMEAGHIKEKMYFDVKKYILPKFQVKIHVPPVLYGTGDITAAATIKVSYTYGKGLQGSGSVNVTSDNDDEAPKLQQIVVKNGDAIVQLKLNHPHYYSYTIYTITANVTEKNTGRWQTGTATIRIFSRETYFVQWLNKPTSYKLGLPMTVQLKITGRDGFPVKEIRPNALRITFPSSLNFARETSIPLSGIVSFSLPTPNETLLTNSTFHVQYKNSMHNFTFPPAASGTSSGIFIDVIPPPNSVHLVQGNLYNFSIISNRPIRPELFHCLLWDDAAMEVHGAQTIVNNHEEAATEFPFSLQLPKAAYTELKVFVYFENGKDGQSEIISTSKAINTHNYLKIRVSRPIPMKNPAPASGINNSSDISANSTVVPPPDAPVETTTTTTRITTLSSTDELEYVYDYPNDDPTAEPQPQPQPLISDKLQVEPGDAVEIHFETYPDSTIAIRGIDQSLLLLTEQDNDLNAEKIKNNRLTTPVRASNLVNITTDTSSFLKTFHRLGIAVLSNEKFDAFGGLGKTSFGENDISEEESEVAPSEDAVVDDSSIPEVNPHIRTKFPETWLWEDFQSSNDSSITVLSKTLPDTLTSWIISGFSLNPKTGLGVASPATITGFMPFFVTLNLPYSVMKLETFDLQVIVHNYLDQDFNVYVTLLNNQNSFRFEDKRDQKTGNGIRKIKVEKDHVAVAHFLITPMVLGDIPIEIRAVTEDGTAGDSMIRSLKVKPDGVQESRSQFVVFNRPKTGDKNLSRDASFDVEFPSKVVEGANSVQLTVVGNPMGTMTSNLGNLLRLPGGCGEQNMAKFVPNILALNYLIATNPDAEEIMKQAKANLEGGYGHQLQYRKPDGSFAVWAHLEGTTWLTSYVLRWFVEAQKYATIDPRVIQGAVDFLLKNQRSDGSFVESGPRYHPEMYGEAGSSVALSAYITLALIKANQISTNSNLRFAIQEGMRFISRGSTYQLDDNYLTNIVTATLMAGDHPEKTRFFEKMEKRSNTTTTKEGVKVKYWDMKNKTERASDPLAIEMTSYALLAHLWKPGKTDSSIINIYRWLLNQRNPQGGFISTQDTAMGLTALTEFALKTIGNFGKEDELQLNIQASSNSPTVRDTKLSPSVARWNRMVLHEFTLPASTNKVNINARGSGPALVQMTETWYVPVKNRVTRSPPNYFNVTAKMTIPDQGEPSDTKLTLCVNSFNVVGAADSIASIELPSGYVFYPDDYQEDSELMAIKPTTIQRFELQEGNTKMAIYYNSIPAHPPTCISLDASQITEVANPKNPPILVYEYLNPARKATVSYEPAHLVNVCQLCRVTDGCQREGCD